MLKRRASLILVAITMLFCLSCTPLVQAQNSPPIVDAGPDQTIYVGEYTLLPGSGWDPDGNFIVKWLWTVESAPAGSSPYISEPDTADPLFAADVAGEYVLRLMATDGMDWSEPDYVTIYVLEILPPVAIATADVTSGSAPLTVNFDGSQSYARSGTELIYDWNFGDSSETSPEVSPTHVYLFPGTYLARLNVLDGIGQRDDDTIWITVYEPTPESAIENLIAHVESMNLQQGIDNSLDTKLTSASDALEALNADQRNDAVNKLNAFINEVEAQRGKKLTNEQADLLIAAAQEVISLIP